MFIDFAVVEHALPALLQGLKVSLSVSAIGIPLGILAGTVAAYISDAQRWPLRALAHGYVELVRNIPFLILVYLCFFGLPKLGLRFSASTIAVGVTAFYTGGYFCEILRAAFRSVAKGQVRAALSLGMRGWQIQRHVVVPLGMPRGRRSSRLSRATSAVTWRADPAYKVRSSRRERRQPAAGTPRASQ